MLRVEFPLLASACQQHFAINLISDGHEEILLISVGDEIIGDTLSFYSKRVRAFMSYISFFFLMNYKGDKCVYMYTFII